MGTDLIIHSLYKENMKLRPFVDPKKSHAEKSHPSTYTHPPQTAINFAAFTSASEISGIYSST